MEKVKDLKKKKEKRKKDFTKRGSLAKIDASITDSGISNALYKIAVIIGRDIDMNTQELNPTEYLKFKNLTLSCVLANKEENKKGLVRAIAKAAKVENSSPIYNIKIKGPNGDENNIYTVPFGKLSKEKNKGQFKYIYEKFKMQNAKITYGYYKTIDYVLDEINVNKDFFLSDRFKQYSYYKETYTEEDFELIKSVSKDLPSKASHLIIDVILFLSIQDRNKELTEKYNRESNGECARAFETKKNIPDKILKVMKRTKFNKEFSYVELDQDTDLIKFKKVEQEWQLVKKALNLEKFFEKDNPQLRFRKLGKHRALGLYYPTLKCICVDITSPDSFLHELGHYIDYTFADSQLSLSKDFLIIVKQYNSIYNEYIRKNPNDIHIDYLKRKRDYFNTPTEIFARCFELFLGEKGVVSSFVGEKEVLLSSVGYYIDDHMKKDVMDYFENLININLDLLEAPRPVAASCSISSSALKDTGIEYVKPILEEEGQYVFDI